ncbi:RNA 3'-terminal phosphate cyclase, partial [Candidatus Thorarchaeota archaeon]
LTGIDLAGQLVGAKTSGLEVGSTEVEFIPRARQTGRFTLDVGTAGSLSLVLQAALPPAILSPEPVNLSLRGGTDVKWSPPVDYLRHVFGHLLRKLGPVIDIRMKRRGHYPKGGGLVECAVTPVGLLKPIDLVEFGKLTTVNGISHCVRLPRHVAERQADAASKTIRQVTGIEPNLDVESYQKDGDPHLGPGSGVVLWGDSDTGARLGADSLGERGVRAEEVGKKAANQLIQEIGANRAVDSHLSDMLIPYLAVADGRSRIGVTKVTSHLITNIWTVERILGMRIDLTGEVGKPGVVSVHGERLSL